MKNPFRSEAEAFRFVIGTVVYFGAIAIATAVGGRWVGLGVFVVLSVARARLVLPPRDARAAAGERAARARRATSGASSSSRTRRSAAASSATRSARRRVARRASVLVVSPGAEHEAQALDLRRGPGARRGRGAAGPEHRGARAGSASAASGEVGDADPVQAIEDALRTFGPDVIIISTHPEGRSNWLERGVVSTARERFAVPITHVVVDLEAEAA